MSAIDVVRTDGGRRRAGFRGEAPGDCVVRAIAIATEAPYREIYDDLFATAKALAERGRIPRGSASPRDGVSPKVYGPWLAERGWLWTPTMRIGSGCTVHLRRDELPAGRLIVRLSRHLAAVVGGVLYDSHDSSRDGTRCVYGYWTKAAT